MWKSSTCFLLPWIVVVLYCTFCFLPTSGVTFLGFGVAQSKAISPFTVHTRRHLLTSPTNPIPLPKGFAILPGAISRPKVDDEYDPRSANRSTIRTVTSATGVCERYADTADDAVPKFLDESSLLLTTVGRCWLGVAGMLLLDRTAGL
jgi:hypothetical protein